MKSIPFSPPMVRALCPEPNEERGLVTHVKTQTRRIVSNLTQFGTVRQFGPSETRGYDWTFRGKRGTWNDLRHADLLAHCPYGTKGDRLWVREAWRTAARFDALKPSELPVDAPVEYDADKHRVRWNKRRDGEAAGRYRHARFMPQVRSRFTLQITDIRVEQVQSISEEDAQAEGLTQREDGLWLPGPCAHPSWAYRELWKRINGAESWDATPWVWVVSFKVVTP